MKLTYKSIEELVEAANSTSKPISQLVLEQQAEELEMTEQAVFDNMNRSFEVMKESVKMGMDPSLRSSSGLTGGSAYLMQRAVNNGQNHFGHLFGSAIAKALAVAEYNSCMGQIVAAPTAGSCGVIPAGLITIMEEKDLPQKDVVMALFTASAIGMVIAKNASISGAEGGCQAEIGSASAMVAGALAELLGGTPEMVANSCAIALKTILGLVCDPVAGLVEVPCVKRNAMGVTNAFVAAELSLAGIASTIPADEVIVAMKRIGDQMHNSLKETAEGGLAATPTGCRLCKKIFG